MARRRMRGFGSSLLALALLFVFCSCRYAPVNVSRDDGESPSGQIEDPYVPDARVSTMLRSTLNEAGAQAYDLLRGQLYACPERVRLTKLSEEELYGVMNALRGDNPLLFFLDSAYSFTTDSLTGRVTLLPKYIDTPEACRIKVQELLTAAKEIEAAAAAGTADEFEMELRLHDALCERCVYASGENDTNAYGAIVQGKAVCEGYALAAKLLFDLAGLDSCVISGMGVPAGEAPERHMWNAVRIGGGWYYLDCTWDDPVMAEGDGVLRHFYFNLDGSLMEKSHRSDDVPGFVDCVDHAQNYFRRMGLYCGEADWREIVRGVIADVDPGDVRELMFADAALLDAAARELFEESGIWELAPSDRLWSRFSYSVDRNTNCAYLRFEY